MRMDPAFMRSRRLGHRLRGAALQLVGRDVLDVGGDPDRVAARLLHAARAVAVELLLRLGDDGAARADRAVEHGVDVLDVEVQHHRRRRMPVGLFAQHDHRVADADLGVADLAVGPLQLLGDARCEHGGEELDEARRVAHHEVGNDGGIAVGDRLHGHGTGSLGSKAHSMVQPGAAVAQAPTAEKDRATIDAMSTTATAPATRKPRTTAQPALLAQLVAALATRRIRVIDLTQTLSPEFPQIALPPEMGQCWPFRIEEVSAYDARGPGWYWNNFSCGEHTGTHFDAPIHWISGKDLPNNSVDTIPAQHFVAPACVIDCSAEAAADPDYLLTVADIERFESAHGRIAEGSWLLMRTDWSKRAGDAEAYQNFDEEGQHTPGPSAEAVRFLVEERNVLGFGSEAIGTDAGQGFHLRPPYPCHYYMHGSGKYGLQCLANLDLLPPTGALLICPPL